jgi:hypothetical protein
VQSIFLLYLIADITPAFFREIFFTPKNLFMHKNRMNFNPAFALVIGLCVLLFSSCSKDISLSNATRNPDEKAAAFQFTDNVSVPIDLIDFIPCANGGVGEEVQFSGILHILFHVTENENGFTVKTHYQPQGVKGIGAVTGDVYNATGVTQDTQSGRFINGSYTYNYTNNYKLIGPGPDNNWLVHENYTITLNANGTITVELDNYSIDCK